MSTVLIVDDEPAICWAFREALTEDGHAVHVAASAEDALKLADEGCRPDAIVMDIRLPGMDGLAAMQLLHQRLGAKPVVVITAFGSLDTAVRAMEAGAFDYLVKPFDLDQATAVLRRALGSVSNDTPSPGERLTPTDNQTLVGSAPSMQQIFKQIALVAASEVSVLITGESGTGKELVARAIHRHSARREGPFLPVCIPALNPGLIESELFGHVRGSFTGATEDRRGLFELAAGGTVLLDEIADVPVGVQVKLLRALEQREVLAVGDTRARPVELRILAATNRSLPDLIAAGHFREDLYFRLGVFHIHLPALRERREDIPALAAHFLTQFRPAGEARNLRLADDTVMEMTNRSWPGNVRELRNAIEHAAIVARGGEIRPEHLPSAAALNLPGQATPAQRAQRHIADWAAEVGLDQPDSADPQVYERFLQLVEPPLLEAILKRCGQNRAAAAQLLGLHRATLRQKLRRHGLS
ncbi:MAG: sigma-54-dependent Fis family transcriptional regulator [Planctomycetaceae bacterium]|nr:sigma-54-dependent Fis family transcriptional regulator [Planctomycetaceae bacterium]